MCTFITGRREQLVNPHVNTQRIRLTLGLAWINTTLAASTPFPTAMFEIPPRLSEDSDSVYISYTQRTDRG